MARVTVYLIILCSLLGLFGINHYIYVMTPVWQQSGFELARIEKAQKELELSEQLATSQNRIENAQNRENIFTITLVLFVGVIIAGILIWFWVVVNKRQESWKRSENGSFALQTFSNAQGVWVVDPNKLSSGAVGFEYASGKLFELPPTLDKVRIVETGTRELEDKFEDDFRT